MNREEIEEANRVPMPRVEARGETRSAAARLRRGLVAQFGRPHGFWKDADETLRQLRDLLAPRGCLAITFQPRSPGATDATSRARGEQIAARFRAAGFAEVRVETRPMKPVAAVCVLGRH